MLTTSLSTEAHDQYLRLRGLRFHYRVEGHSGTPPVVVLHGIMGHAREWDVLVSALAPRFRVYVLDQRGHGQTEWADEYTASAMADDLIALIEHLELDRPRVIGHSMGGMAAMLAAARRPDVIEQLVVLDVGPDTVSGQLAVELAAFVKTLGSASYSSVDEAYAEWSENPLARPELLRHYVEHCLVRREDGQFRWRFDGIGLSRFFAGVTESELWEAVVRISCPVLLLRGEYSPALSQSSAAEMVRRLRDARLAAIPGAGHDLGVEQPEAVADAAIDFLST